MSTAVAFSVVTVFWAVVGGVIPWLIPKGPNKGIVQTMLVTTAVCCYLFWLCTIMMQLNPLFGPELDTATVYVMQHEWSKA